jgi:hypothetical protein
MRASLLPRRGGYNVLIRLGGGRGAKWGGGAGCLALQRGKPMNLPKIDISALPDLDTLTGVFGSLAHPAQSLQSDDSIVVLMVFVYDIIIT